MTRELCDPWSHREPYVAHRGRMNVHTAHVTTNPPLLTQLADAVEQSGSAEDGRRPAFGSKPSARIDAIDTLIRIDVAASRLLKELGNDDDRDTAGVVRLLASLAPSQPEHTARRIELEVGRWWTWARIATAWDTPAWSPDNTCPLCAKRGGLRIRLADHIGTCLECQETWDDTNLGLLADHIRAECEDEGRTPLPLTNRVPCQCRTCTRVDADALVLCPWCASSRCPKAVDHMWPCTTNQQEAS